MILSTFMRVALGVVVWCFLVYTSYWTASSLADLKLRKNEMSDVLFAAFCFVIALAASIGLCVEMFVNNPHYGIYSQVCINAFLYAVACALGFSGHEESRRLCSIFSAAVAVFFCLFLVTLVLAPLSIFDARLPDELSDYEGKEFSIEHEVIESHNIISAGDAYGVEGRGFIGVFAIDTNGCYRYYYRGDDGAVEQGDINTSSGDKLFDDCTKDGEPPRIEKVRSYTGYYYVYNKQLRRHIDSDSMRSWDELHVPEGSIVCSYNFDLQ